MKRITPIFLSALVLLCGCNHPQPEPVPCACEDVSQPSDRPWIEELIQKSQSGWWPIRFVDKVFYILPDDSTTYVGFYYEVEVSPGSCDVPYASLLDCDGEGLATWGGITGCDGLCNLTIISRTRIYQREE